MKKRLLVILLALAATLCLAFALSACSPAPNDNTGNTTEQSGNTGNSGNSGNNSGSSGSTGNTNTPEGESTGSTTEPETPDTGNTEHVHDWGEWVLTTPATCSTQGEETRTCRLDENHKETRKTQIDPTAHKFKHVEAQAATCVAKGWNDHDECELCGYSENKIESNIDPEAHDWGEWKVTTPATCSAQGEEIRTCKLDENHTESHKTSIDPNAHTYGTDNVCTGCKQPWNFTANLQYELSTDNKSYSVTGIGTATETNIVIPYFYNKLPVTSIGGSAFDYCTSLKSITIPDGVTSIGDCEFQDCTSLTSITIPDGVTSIGSYAFEGCTKLIQTQDGVQYVDKWVVDCDTSATNVNLRANTKGIANGAFEDCKSIASVTITNSVIFIGADAFYNCTSLASIIIPNSVNSIGVNAFVACGLTSIAIPKNVTAIGSGAFANCKKLENITVDENNTAYSSQDGILYNKNKTEIISVPCTKTVVTISDSVTSIDNYAFCFCANLTSIIIPDNVTSIGDLAFYECTSLTSITIPDSVTSIGIYAFYNCTSLESVTFVNKTGWKVRYLNLNSENWTDVNADDSANNTKLLTDTYCMYFWKREG